MDETNQPVPFAAAYEAERAARRAALRFRVRWFFFVMALVGLVVMALSIVATGWIGTAHPFGFGPAGQAWGFAAMVALLGGMAVGVVGGTGFLGYSVASLLLGSGGPTAPEGSRDLAPFALAPSLTEARLRLWGFWLAVGVVLAQQGTFLWVVTRGDLDRAWAIAVHTFRTWWWLDDPFVHAFFGSLTAAFAALLIPARPTQRVRELLGAAPPALPPASSPAAAGGITYLEAASSAPAQAPARCPVCGYPVLENPTACPRCRTLHHHDCWSYAGGCAIFGCRSDVARAPAQERALEALRGDVRGWLGLYRASFAALSVAVVAVAVASWSWALPTWRYVEWGQDAVAALGFLFGTCGTVVSLAALAVYGLLELPLRRSRRRVEGALEQPLRPPPGASREVVDRLDPSAGEELLRGALLGVAAVSALIALLLPAADRLYGPLLASDSPAALLYLVLAATVALPLAAYAASSRRLAFVASQQNRLAASLLARKGSAGDGQASS